MKYAPRTALFNPLALLKALLFIFMVLAYFCSLYVTDSIASAASVLQKQLDFSNLQIGSFNGISVLLVPIFVILFGTWCDKFGPIKVLTLSTIMGFVGSLLAALTPNYDIMLLGRLLFGIGAEGLIVAEAAAIAIWFKGPWFSSLLALHVALARLGSFTADISPSIFPSAYRSWQGPLWLSFAFSVLAMVSAIICLKISETKTCQRIKAYVLPSSRNHFRLSQFNTFTLGFWCIIFMGLLFYGPIVAFRSSFAIVYFQNVHELSLKDAGQLNSYVFLAAAIATPIFGWICDRFGKHALLLAFGMIMSSLGFLILALNFNDLILVTVLFGIAYSLIPAVLWPAAAYVVSPGLIGTAYGLMIATQNVSQGLSSMTAGLLSDYFHASASNPSGYTPMLWFFVCLTVMGLLISLVLLARRDVYISKAIPSSPN